ncbi:Fic family protein [Ectothiorhodospira shaposhnikovii]|uniref:Fic family protein n=1 Tax=Ectothiorhodospira shaposhnikovii TaxID=1054 RepID=UPI001A928D3F|nr:Fic family protein [Ectothiorhodospira shaposhnikovii]
MSDLSKRYSLDLLNIDHRNFDEMAVDFVYTSAKIEGNTYDRIDTDNLLRMGITAGGKRYSDAVMIVNLRNAFNDVMNIEDNTKLDLDYLCDLHKVIMKDLLPLHEQGIVRTSGVRIGASSYTPLADPGQLRTEMKHVLAVAEKYSDPFEQAIYLHCNTAYLQYFRDGNKRTARLMQTAALVRGHTLPLFFSDTLIEQYQRASVHFYETGDYGSYASFFKENYALTVGQLFESAEPSATPYEAEERARRISKLQELSESTGPARTFWLFAQDAIRAKGSPEFVNWPDVERRTIIECILANGQSPDDVEAAIFKHSPSATSPEKKQAISEDIKGIKRIFLDLPMPQIRNEHG